jgi:REP element-mobilizing transposase RayT
MSKEIPLLSGQYYHIYNRGNNGENLFQEERNYAYFFKLYIHYIYPIADTYAYCLMRNHFHLLVRINPKPDLTGFKNLSGLDAPLYSKQFSNLFNAYTKTINKTYQRTGNLFERPFKRILVDSDRYFIHLISYIHRNPQKHGFTNDFRTYPYSSFQTIQQQKTSRIAHAQVLQWFGNLHQFENYHQSFDDNKIAHLIEEDF